MKITTLIILSTLLAAVSCDDGNDDKYENYVELEHYAVYANTNGTLTIESSVKTNIRLVEYAIFDENYNVSLG